MGDREDYAQPGYFDRIYAENPDPWRFATSDYERVKYEATMAALPGRFARAFEIGCSIGVLTRHLAASCDALLAVDIAPAAVSQATIRCQDLPWVHIETMDVRSDWPAATFDLILFSEVLYYLGLDGIRDVAERAESSLAPGGTVALVNWRGDTEAACTGEEAAETFLQRVVPALEPVLLSRAEQFRIDVLVKRTQT